MSIFRCIFGNSSHNDTLISACIEFKIEKMSTLTPRRPCAVSTVICLSLLGPLNIVPHIRGVKY